MLFWGVVPIQWTGRIKSLEVLLGKVPVLTRTSMDMNLFKAFFGEEVSSFVDEYRRMYPNQPREHYTRLTDLGLLVQWQLKSLNVMTEKLRDLCRMPGFPLKRFGIISHDPYDQLDLASKRPGDMINMSFKAWSADVSQTFFFANTCELPLHATDTHIAVGFNDLGILLRLEFDDRALCRFIAVDCSLYAVVKALILVKLFETDAAVEHIAQIWFSSVWNADTLGIF